MNGILAISNLNFYVYSVIFLGLIVYLYFSFSLNTISRKLNYKKSWLAWIPIAQIFLFPILARKPWYYGFLIFLPFLSYLFYSNQAVFSVMLFILGIFSLAFTIFWNWSIFERRNYPGWLSLLLVLAIIPGIDFFATILYLLLIGVVAIFDIKK